MPRITNRLLPSALKLSLAPMLALGWLPMTLPISAKAYGPVSNSEVRLPPALDAPVPAAHDGPIVQLALLLDTSNSMDGLIDQARSELWTVVNTLRGLQHDAGDVQFQIALYQYGNDELEAADGYVQLRAPFTTDLDRVSEQLFALTTDGGSEYCGWVIDDASDDLAWIAPSTDERDVPVLRMIVIAGNEPFTQGGVAYDSAIPQATARGVRVHTVYCGGAAQGRTTSWEAGATLGEGFYFAIDQGQRVEYVTPFDDRIIELGGRLNTTYLSYGGLGGAASERQLEMDAANAASVEQAVQRSASKASKFYDNRHWDLVDAYRLGDVVLEEIDPAALPAEYRELDAKELERVIQTKQAEREALQEELNELYAQREEIVRAKREESGVRTLGVALAQAIIDQAREQGFGHVDDEPEDPQPIDPLTHETGEKLGTR